MQKDCTFLARKRVGDLSNLNYPKTSVVGMDTYLNNTNDWMLKLVKKHEQNKRMHSINSDAKKIFK